MARRRFFVEEVRSGEAELTGEEARHLARVLRAEPGQRYELSDNESAYLAEIVSVRKDAVRFRVVEKLASAGDAPPLILLAALIKFDRFEWMIEKSTELGVSRIVPVDAARTDSGLMQAAQKRIDRWRKIARESSQQARRVRMPEIAAAATFEQALTESAALRIRLEEESHAAPLSKYAGAPDSIALLVGPEGGWTDAERHAAAQSGWTPVSLGPAILRAETAAIAAIAIVAHCLSSR